MLRVVDSSVVCKLLLPEQWSDVAEGLLDPKYLLSAPDFILVEIANVLWKRVRQDEITTGEARELLAEAVRFPIELQATNTLLTSALNIAAETGRTVYDCCYIALARSIGAPCVTADERLVNALRASPYGAYVTSLAEL